jgi:hypothetical protein
VSPAVHAADAFLAAADRHPPTASSRAGRRERAGLRARRCGAAASRRLAGARGEAADSRWPAARIAAARGIGELRW